MKKLFNVILSLLTIALFVLYIYSKINGVVPFDEIGVFLLEYGALILLGLFTFNNLLSKVMGVFFVIFVVLVIVLIILFVNPSIITNIFA